MASLVPPAPAQLKFYACLAVCMVANVLGVLCFTVRRDLTVRSLRPLRLYSAALAAAYLTYFGVDFHTSTRFFNSNYTKSIIFVEFLLYWCVSATSFVLCIARHGRLEAWMRGALEGWRGEGQDRGAVGRAVAWLAAQLGGGFLLLGLYNGLAFVVRRQPNMNGLAQLLYFSLCSNTMVVLLLFVNGTLLVRIFFVDINQCLVKMFQVQESGPRYTGGSCVGPLRGEYLRYAARRREGEGARLSEVRALSQRHHHACALAAALNDCFSPQLLAFIGLCFVELTYSMYYMITSTTNCTSDLCLDTRGVVAFSLAWAAFYIFQLTACAVSCHLTAAEAGHTGVLLHNLINREAERSVQSALEMFSLQVQQWSLGFTALGFFPVDNTLLYMMVGGVTSALVVLIQFQRYSSSFFNIYYQNMTAGGEEWPPSLTN